jgi:hypothetical protein
MSSNNVIQVPHGIEVHGEYMVRIPKNHVWFTTTKGYNSEILRLSFCNALLHVIERELDVENKNELRVFVPPRKKFFEVRVEKGERNVARQSYMAWAVAESAFHAVEERGRLDALRIKMRSEDRSSHTVMEWVLFRVPRDHDARLPVQESCIRVLMF